MPFSFVITKLNYYYFPLKYKLLIIIITFKIYLILQKQICSKLNKENLRLSEIIPIAE